MENLSPRLGDRQRYPNNDHRAVPTAHLHMKPLSLFVAALAFAVVCGCSDPTLPHREQLAICLVQSIGPLNLDYDAIPPEMHRMHMGAANARRTADCLEEFLERSPPLDKELLELVEVYAVLNRKLEQQFASAVADGRSDLNEEEAAIAHDCGRQDMFLFREICEQIDFDSIVTTSP